MTNQKSKIKQLTFMALFATIATVVMFLEMPLPFMPPFLKLDFSGAVVLIGALILGPVQGVAIALVKSLIHVFSSSTGGVGELADFLMTGAFVFVVSSIYHRLKSKKGTIIGCGAGIAAITIVGVVANKFLIIPFYSNIMPIEAIVSACGAVNPLIGSIDGYLLFGVVPFNVLKGLVLSVVGVYLYKKLNKPGIMGDQFAEQV